jgi:hypothetical protein
LTDKPEDAVSESDREPPVDENELGLGFKAFLPTAEAGDVNGEDSREGLVSFRGQILCDIIIFMILQGILKGEVSLYR